MLLHNAWTRNPSFVELELASLAQPSPAQPRRPDSPFVGAAYIMGFLGIGTHGRMTLLPN